MALTDAFFARSESAPVADAGVSSPVLLRDPAEETWRLVVGRVSAQPTKLHSDLSIWLTGRFAAFRLLPLRYECDQCGACCKQLLVEVYDLDVLREPRLATADIGSWTRDMLYAELMAELEQEGKCLLIAGPGKPCQFLDDENRCGIYPTRPNVCVALPAGNDQCQQARKAAGLDPLQPIEDAGGN